MKVGYANMYVSDWIQLCSQAPISTSNEKYKPSQIAVTVCFQFQIALFRGGSAATLWSVPTGCRVPWALGQRLRLRSLLWLALARILGSAPTSPSLWWPLETVLSIPGGADLSTHSGSSPEGCGSSALQLCWAGPSPWGWEHLRGGTHGS